MAVAATTGTTGTSDALASGKATLATSYDTFLKLLTTQFNNFDPPAPTETTEMTSQITQMMMAAPVKNSRVNQSISAATSQGASLTGAAGATTGVVALRVVLVVRFTVPPPNRSQPTRCLR